MFDDYARSHANNFCCKFRNGRSSYYDSKYSMAIELINNFYPLIVDALNSAASCNVKRAKGNLAKHLWTEELQELKIRSIESHRMWKDANRPRNGSIYDIYMKDKYSYKLQIRTEKSLSELTITNVKNIKKYKNLIPRKCQLF